MQRAGPQFHAIYLFVADVERTAAFYSLLGLEVELVGGVLGRAWAGAALVLEFGTAQLTRSYDPWWSPPELPCNAAIGFSLPSDDAVDETHYRLVRAGHASRLDPCTPPWQARFALVIDPDGNLVGLHGPRDVQQDRSRERGDD